MYTTSITTIPSKKEGPSSSAGHKSNTKVINESTEEK